MIEKQNYKKERRKLYYAKKTHTTTLKLFREKDPKLRYNVITLL